MVVQTFLFCATQWVYAGMAGQRTGLHYPGVDTVLRLTVPRADRQRVFHGLQIMEYAALGEFAAQAEALRTRRAARPS